MDQLFKIPLEEFVQGHEGMDSLTFSATYTDPFLVVERQRGSGETSEYHTLITGEDGLEEASKTRQGRPVCAERGEKYLFSITKSGRNSFHGKITVGRAINNDIIVDNGAISKFHAFFEKNRDLGAYTIMDVGSTNGTYLRDGRIAANVRTQVQSGDSIIFANAVSATFFEGPDFHAYMALMREAWQL